MSIKIAVTTVSGVETVTRRECEKLGAKNIQVSDKLITCEGDITLLIQLNLWLRTANRVYVIAQTGQVNTFEDLFQMTKSVNWKQYVPNHAPIYLDTVTHKNLLTSEPAIQKTVKKAMVESIIGPRGTILPEDENIPGIRILTLLLENTGMLLIDTSGEPLHKRGYRRDAGEAPIKESLAAALIYISNWQYKTPFYDVCTGSGTFPIEAAMIARNIAPGLQRNFAFETWDWIPKHILEAERVSARKQQFPSGTYKIYGADIDPEMIEKAQYNSRVAGVATDIQWEVQDLSTQEIQTGCILSNPPYGERLNTPEIDSIHATFQKLLRQPEVFGGIITNHESFIQSTRNFLDRRKLMNGPIQCNFCYKREIRAHSLKKTIETEM